MFPWRPLLRLSPGLHQARPLLRQGWPLVSWSKLWAVKAGKGGPLAGRQTFCLFSTALHGLGFPPPQDYGQPTSETHPELLAPGEVTPGISASEYAARRCVLSGLLPAGSAAILDAAPPVYMAGVIPYPYRQASDYLYLTGCQQPGSVAILEKKAEGDNAQFAMFMPPRDVARERWDGPLADVAAAHELFGADQAQHMDQLDAAVAALVARGVHLFYDGRREDQGLHHRLPHLGRALEQGLVRPLRPLVHALRWRKSPAEVERMRAVSAVTAAAFKESMRVSVESCHEHKVAATFEYECKRRGASRMAYPPVVGGGVNGCYIHYSRHDRQVRPGELLTMDAGCELHGYASDVTRTWPVAKKFTPDQARVYSAILSVWHECLAMCRPGRTLQDIHATSVRLLSAAMAEFGAPVTSRLPHTRPYTRFYAHYVGHWLGMDTHDCASVSYTTPLQPGVVLALEPGLYFPAHRDTPQWLWNIGIRIEDDILITEGAPEVLSKHIPREIEEIEALLHTFGTSKES